MNKLFRSKYPIVSAPMNKVSDAKLAIAVFNAGGVPSISAYNFRFNGTINYVLLRKEFEKFKTTTNSNNIILSISAEEITNLEFIKFLEYKLFSHIELICESIKLTGITLNPDQINYFKTLELNVKILKEYGITIILKSLTRFLIKEVHEIFKNTIFDAYVIKGPDGAGSIIDFNASRSLEDDIVQLRTLFSDIVLIASGGVGDSADVRKMIELGATAVSIGTLFAMSTDSSISHESKNAVLERKPNTVEKFKNSNQRAVIFSTIVDDDLNHTNSLIKGIASPKEGHLFIGKGISKVTNILSVNEIMQSLIKELE